MDTSSPRKLTIDTLTVVYFPRGDDCETGAEELADCIFEMEIQREISLRGLMTSEHIAATRYHVKF